MKKRVFIQAAAAVSLLASVIAAHAQTTPIKFQLDWRFEGPAALFLTPAAKGYFKDAKLDVSVDAGNGSGGAVTRVASGAYDITVTANVSGHTPSFSMTLQIESTNVSGCFSAMARSFKAASLGLRVPCSQA